MSATETELILYINGVKTISGDRPGGEITSSHPIVIGGNHLGRFQTCRLGPVRIYYDKALTSDEVNQNYSARNPDNPEAEIVDLGPIQAIVDIINNRVADNSAAIESIENKLVINLAISDIVDPTPFVVTDSTPWNENGDKWQPSNAFLNDGLTVTNVALLLDVPGPTGFAFMEFDAWAVVAVSGFRIGPHAGVLRRFPRDIHLFAGTSSSGPWTQIGMSILVSAPPNGDKITSIFPSRSARYFRWEFTDVKEDMWAQFDTFTFTLLAAQSIDVLEFVNTRITQLENAAPTLRN